MRPGPQPGKSRPKSSPALGWPYRLVPLGSPASGLLPDHGQRPHRLVLHNPKRPGPWPPRNRVAKRQGFRRVEFDQWPFVGQRAENGLLGVGATVGVGACAEGV